MKNALSLWIKNRNDYQGLEKGCFGWGSDFTLPTTDNLAERGLRSIKSHMKISGQFESERSADDYAMVKTYVETCRKMALTE